MQCSWTKWQKSAENQDKNLWNWLVMLIPATVWQILKMKRMWFPETEISLADFSPLEPQCSGATVHWKWTQKTRENKSGDDRRAEAVAFLGRRCSLWRTKRSQQGYCAITLKSRWLMALQQQIVGSSQRLLMGMARLKWTTPVHTTDKKKKKNSWNDWI